ncbi:putative oxidoreductase [Azospirillum lipoferum]|uniref:DoxX family protein n=1 Tax=Azospirillum TaxID=191 RepID=UPI001FEA9282|nr:MULTISPECIES: DoxX family protein [Azospirillum]MCP1615066.1 putative oxidoreductase [Azospirillum lipoferum]MDW5532964.1 DoxX family protein [Azospirillum sp. NL1]
MTSSNASPWAQRWPLPARLAQLSDLRDQTAGWLDRHAVPLFDLAVRLTMAPIFFRSGLQKIGDWPATLFLFQEEYRVPLLPPEVAALLAAATELTMPVLLVLGLATRLAALPLLAMALVIQFVLGAANPAFSNPQHYFWMLLLSGLILRGGGRLSVDHWLLRISRRQTGDRP